MPDIKFDAKTMAMGLGVLGILGGGVAGIVKVTTPAEEQCQIDLADAKARLSLLTEVKDSCKAVLATMDTTSSEGKKP